MADGPYSLVRSQNVYNHGFSRNGLAFISEAQANALSNVELAPGDVLLNITGDSVARACQVESEVLPARVNQHVAIIRPNPNKIDATFLRYYLVSPMMQAHMLGLAAAGATRNALTKGMIGGFHIPNIEIDVQRAIASVLGSLDNKIDLNLRMNETLEAMARAIFNDWFVNFGPTRAKVEGREPYLAQEIWDLFPDKLDDDGLPVGWEVEKIENIIKRYPVGKKYSQNTASNAGNIPILDQGKSGIIGYHNNEPGVHASKVDPIIVFANHTCYMRLIINDFSAIQNVLPFKGKDIDIYWLYCATVGRQQFVEYKGHWPDFVIKETIVPIRELYQRALIRTD